jgi:long-chain acyl-CoA synthetase
MATDTPEHSYQINEKTYANYIRAIQILDNSIGLNLKIHNADELLNTGQIFLFNHFARFETIIPPYIIFKNTGAYCRTIADHKLFDLGDVFRKFLIGGGAVPDNLPGLLPFLAAEILRGRKVVIFPEGGMIKDRRVIDDYGRFQIYSPSSLVYRKHHQGAAVLALTLDLFKHRVQNLFKRDDRKRIEVWCTALGLSAEALLIQVNTPTLIIPSTITFHPIRIDDNILNKGIELFAGGMSNKVADELTIESNLLLRETDMDIRIGAPIRPQIRLWSWLYNLLTNRYFLTIDSLNDFFGLKQQADTWCNHLLVRIITKASKNIRDKYMKRLYAGVTVNISHLASIIITILKKNGREKVPAHEFNKVLYLAIKKLQAVPNVYLHRGINIVQNYQGLLAGDCEELHDFLDICEQAKLLAVDKGMYRFLERPAVSRRKKDIRLEDPVQIRTNEVAPIPQVRQAVVEALDKVKNPDDFELAQYLFDDELRDFAWNRREYSKKIFQEIHKKETATNSGEPCFFLPKRKSRCGILLVHGFLASPAELAGFGEEMRRRGHNVLIVRLAGHGTSPFDLQKRSWQEWLDSVRRGYRILATISDHIVVMGFSTGGALSLLLAAEKPHKLAGVAAVATPLAVKDKNITFVPMVNFFNKLVDLVPGVESIHSFYESTSAHPETNYHSMPLTALQEFRSLMKALKETLPEITCPALILQSNKDPIVTPESCHDIFKKLSSPDKTLHILESDRHNLIYENIGETWDYLEQFIPKVVEDELLVDEIHHSDSPDYEKSYPPGLAWHLAAVNKPVHTLLEESAERFAGHRCLSFLGRHYLYSEIQEMVNHTAAGLQHLGIKKGDRIGLCLPNSPYFVVAYYAALKVGAIVVNFNPLYTAEETAAQITDGEVTLMFTLDIIPLYPKIAEALGKTTLKKIVVCPFAEALPSIKSLLFTIFKRGHLAAVAENEHNIFFADLIRHGNTPGHVDIDPARDIALLQYTGGTTGIPKGAMLTHTNVTTNTEQVRLWLGDVNQGGEKFLAVLPFFHVFAMTSIMNLGIATGSELILLPRFELKGLLATIVKERPTLFPAVPTIFSAINAFPGIERLDLSSIRFCISGGAPLPSQIKVRFEQLTGCTVVEGYGLSETSPVVSCNPLYSGGKPDSIGLPLPGTEIEIRSLKDPGTRVKAGTNGEICIRGPQVMAGYWKNEPETKKAFVDGWFRTGDVGYTDAEGYIFLTDRLKEIIIVSGYNIYPRIIENALYRHPQVEEAVVIGVPDAYKGEVPKAFVKLKSGASVTEKELLAFSTSHLNPIEHLAYIEFRRQLPKTLVGKLSKKELVAEEARRAKVAMEGKR